MGHVVVSILNTKALVVLFKVGLKKKPSLFEGTEDE